MITLTAEKIRDFQTCGLLYDYRHIEEKLEPITHREILLSRFEMEIKKILSFFFYKRQGGNTPSYNALLNRWQRSWFDGDTTAYDLAVAQQEPHVVNETNLTTRAANVLRHFYDDFSTIDAQPLLIDEAVSISLSDDIRLSGSYDIALRKPRSNELLILKWVTRSKGSWAGNIDYNMDFAMIDYLFRNKSSLAALCTPKYAVYELGNESNKMHFHEVEDRHRNALEHWSNKIGETNIFAPVRGLSVACKSCPFDGPCSIFDRYTISEDTNE
jgi:hypothetical protein